MDGEILSLFTDEEGEWLEIGYENLSKQVQRFLFFFFLNTGFPEKSLKLVLNVILGEFMQPFELKNLVKYFFSLALQDRLLHLLL